MVNCIHLSIKVSSNFALKFLYLGLFVFSIINIAEAALSTQTAKTIHGTAPYITFDGGTTKVTTTDGFLDIKLSNGVIYKKSTNTSSALSPIELPVVGQSFADIEMLVPATTSPISSTDPTQRINLDDIFASTSPKYWGDNDGDNSVSVTGSLSVVIKDSMGAKIKRGDRLVICNSPYSITLTTTSGALSTQYGNPRSTSFTGASTIYYVKPKIGSLDACWAKPNLSLGDNNNATGHGIPGSNYQNASYTVWDPTKGYKLQNLNTASSNFPRTGANGFFFDFTVGDALASSVTAKRVSGSSNISLTLTPNPGGAGTNVVRVTLNGPKHPSAGTFSPTKFDLYAGSIKVYSFEISKWFIAKPSTGGGGAVGAQTYCSGLSGSYRVPSVGEYTNAKNATSGWNGTLLSWNNNNYARMIGNGSTSALPSLTGDGKGGLFSEWGDVSYYTGSDFASQYYWANEPHTAPNHIAIYALYGSIAAVSSTNTHYRNACVSP